MLPDVRGLKGPFSCLIEARYGIMWGAMGAARDAYEVASNLESARTYEGTDSIQALIVGRDLTGISAFN